MKVLAALNRYHGFDGRLGLPRAAQTRNALAAPPPLALTHAAEPRSRRSRRELHNLAPKTLISLARLSSLQIRPDAMETRLYPSSTLSLPSRRSAGSCTVWRPRH
jgi:hypothetical protein